MNPAPPSRDATVSRLVSRLRDANPLDVLSRVDSRATVGAVGLVTIGGYLLYLAYAMQHQSYDIWGGLFLLPILTAVSLPIVWRVGRDDDDPMHGIIGLAVVAKLLASIPRYYVVFTVYGGNADADTYNDFGVIVSNRFRHGELSFFDIIPRHQGTDFLKELTGFVYSILGPTRLGGFVFFSWLGFWGLLLMYRAALLGFPEIEHRRYAYMLFFLPSLLFWPSSIGKEAWLMLGLGTTVYGAARFLTEHRGGILVTALGCVLTGYVRPHVTAIAVVALGMAFVVRRSEHRTATVTPIKKLLGIGVLVMGCALAVTQTGRFLGDNGDSSVSGILNRAQSQSSSTPAGSSFDAERANSPLEYPVAFVSVMFRPSLLDVRSANQAISAVETTFVAVLFVFGWRRVVGSLPWLFRRPYLLFCVVYSGLFAFAWSSIGNFGILVRQRVLAWPFFVILLAVPWARTKREQAPEPRPEFRRRAVPV